MNAQIILAVKYEGPFNECYGHISDVLHEFRSFEKVGASFVTFETEDLSSINGAIEEAYTNLTASHKAKLIFHLESAANKLLRFGNLDGDYSGERFVLCKKLKKISKGNPKNPIPEQYECELEISMIECSGSGKYKVSYTARMDGQLELVRLNIHLIC